MNWHGLGGTGNTTMTFSHAFSNDIYAIIGAGFAIEGSGEQYFTAKTSTYATTTSSTRASRTAGALFIGT